MSRAIGMFDSGVGGISVLRDAVRMLPHERFIFYGDNQNAPYGVKTQCEILNCTQRAIQTLLERNVKALVLACNTATAAAAKELRAKLDIPVIGMEPALKPAHFLRHGGQILVLATPATLHMEKFRHLMEQYGEGAVPVEGYGLVECIESGHVAPDDPQLLSVLHKLLDPHLDVKTDAVVLGCTHYVFAREALRRIVPGAALVDGNEGTVRQLTRRLGENGALEAEGEGGYELHTSGGESIYLPLMKKLMSL